MIARGRKRSGRRTSPPTKVMLIQPSYAHSAATVAAPQRAAAEPLVASRPPAISPAGWSPRKTHSATIAPAMASLATVVTFWVLADARTLRQFHSERPRIVTMTAAFCARSDIGTKSPAYSTKTTATAAIDAVWMTANRLQP